nr:putative reverse transcriptase domain-containing protein [Tanacetum cinerariifolium]
IIVITLVLKLHLSKLFTEGNVDRLYVKVRLEMPTSRGLEMTRETKEMIVQIKNQLLAARSRQKSYADVRHKPLEFKVGDKVMRKVSSWKGPVAYKLELPRDLQGIHNTFHVSNLKKCLSDEDLIIPFDEVRINEKYISSKNPLKSWIEKKKT